MHQIAGLEARIAGNQVARRLDVDLIDRPDFVNAILDQSEGVVESTQPLVSKVVVQDFLKDFRRRNETLAPLQETLQ